MKILRVCFLHLKVFVRLWINGIENYECLVVSNNAKSNKLEDQIFWYKASPHRDFKLGSKEFWEMSKNLDSDDEDEPNFDPKGQRKGSSY